MNAAEQFARRHRFKWWEALPWIAGIAAYFVFPNYLSFLSQLLITILFALSLDLVLGYAGIVTLGHAAFFGAGAYTVGMLAMHSFMFISSYEDMRARLREQVAILTMAHFGGGLFAVGNPGTLQTTAFVFEKRASKVECDNQEGVYFRLVGEIDAESKRQRYEAALAALYAQQTHPNLFITLCR